MTQGRDERELAALRDALERCTPEQREHLDAIRADGATDMDIVRWNRVSSRGREREARAHHERHVALYQQRRRQGDGDDEAQAYALRHQPQFRNPGSAPPVELAGDDRPLPMELAPRIAQWMARHGRDALRHVEAGGYSSLNALLRDLVVPLERNDQL